MDHLDYVMAMLSRADDPHFEEQRLENLVLA